MTVVLFNADGHLIRGEQVSLTTDLGTVGPTAQDNGDGTYSTTYQAVNQVGTADKLAVAGYPG
ncbi:MAG: hypothetical protein QGH37_10020 [Candidatus Poribacteria bacterium]|nr:hypothetical protein [Candidatus Poribacteria bacterium]